MGLRVWLPLNGSLENQGLSNVIFTNNGAATNTNGKIGSCYSFNGSSNYLKATYNFYSSQYTVSAWVYTTSTSATQNIVCDRTSVGSGFAIFLIGGKLRIDSGGNNLQWTTNYTFPANIWFHLTIIYDGTDTSYYINGVFQEKKAHTISSSYWGNTTSVGSSQANGTGWGNFLNGRLNDVRIYDHALSVKEVRELARGLMVHYKLDSPEVEGTTNYALDPRKDTYSSISPGWDTTKHVGAVSVANWNTGYNGGVPDPSHGYHAMWKIIDGIPVIVFQDHNSEIGQTHRWLGTSSYSLSSTFISNTPAGTKYCISFDMKTIDALGGKVNVGVYYKKTSSSSNNFYDGNKTATANTLLNTWERKTLTFTRSSEYDGNTNSQVIYVYGQYGSEATMYVRNIQLEIKDHSTPYTSSTRTASKVVDCSGFKYHGTIINTLAINTDTPRYDYSTYFNTTASKITLPAINFSGTSTTYTFAWWQYMVNTARMAWGIGNGNRLNVYYSNPICWNTGDGTSTPFQDGTTTINPSELLNSWHHIAVTGDGAAAKIYIDGVYRGTAKTWRAITGTQIYISGWDTGTSYSWSGGKLSDFRIYATTLTATDVHDLYATSAEVDRNGNYYSREVIEK